MEGEEKGLPERNKGVQSGFGAGTDQKEGKNKEAAVQMDVDRNQTEIGGSSDLGKESGKSMVDDQTGDGSELVGSSGCKSRNNAGDQSESVESSGSKNVLKRPQSMTSGLNLSNQRNKTRRTGDGSKAGGAGTNQDIENVEDDDEMEGGVEGNQGEGDRQNERVEAVQMDVDGDRTEVGGSSDDLGVQENDDFGTNQDDEVEQEQQEEGNQENNQIALRVQIAQRYRDITARFESHLRATVRTMEDQRQVSQVFIELIKERDAGNAIRQELYEQMNEDISSRQNQEEMLRQSLGGMETARQGFDSFLRRNATNTSRNTTNTSSTSGVADSDDNDDD